MNPIYDTNVAATMVLWAARHAVRLGIEGVIRLDGETIPEPEGEDIDYFGNVRRREAKPPESRLLKHSPAEWLAKLEPYEERLTFDESPLLAGCRWKVPPYGVARVLDPTNHGEVGHGLAMSSSRRIVKRSKLLTDPERERLIDCPGGDACYSPVFRAGWRPELSEDPAEDWERLPFVQKMQKDMAPAIEAVRSEFWGRKRLLVDRLGVVSDMEIAARANGSLP